MAGDFNKPVVTDNYSLVLQAVREVLADMAKGLDPALSLGTTNIPINAIRWNSVGLKWEKFNGTTWGDLSASYAIQITGSSASWTAGRTIQLTGDVTGTSGAFDGSGNLSFVTTLGTVPAAKGGTGLTSYSIGDLLYASGTAALSKLAGVATGNALLSGGIGSAPGWGKIGLTTHVSGTLPTGNGGTGSTTATGTGANVLANSPTLVTPDLGTPSNLVGTNISGTAPGLSIGGSSAYAGSAGSCTNSAYATWSTLQAFNTNNTAIATTSFVIQQVNKIVIIGGSTVNPFPAGGIYYGHGLGFRPVSFVHQFRCDVAEQGYSVGDYVESPHLWDSSVGYGLITPLWADANYVGKSGYGSAMYFLLHNKTTGALFSPSAGKWSHVFVVTKI